MIGRWRHFRPAFRDLVSLGRYDRPIGIWLLMWPCWWSITLARPDGATLASLLGLFLLGAAAARAGGCAWNDLVDRDADRRVERTRDRPLAAGRLGTGTALAFIALHLSACAAVLPLLAPAARLLALAAVPLVLLYPFAKRFTWWPQAWLGVTFNWGALAGWAAATGEAPGPPALLLYAAGIAWTLGYDTLYAYQDREGDILAGIRSSAVRLGGGGRRFAAAAAAAAAGLAGLALAAAGSGWAAWAGLAGFALLLVRAALAADLADPASCLAAFRASHPAAAALFAGLLADALMS